MKKGLILTFVTMFFILAACGNSADSENNTNEPENNEANTNQKSNENEANNEKKDEAESENNENENNENEVENTTAEVEENEPKYELNSGTWSIDPIEDADEKIVLVTIDDAPDKHALEMAETLQELNVNAIFFVNGHLMESDEKKKVIKEIHDMGFVIGNHTYSHKSLQDLSEEEQKEEIISVNDMVEEIIGERPKFFRAPFGQNTDYSKQLANEEGMTLMNWSYGYDWEPEYQTQEAITDIMINTNLLGNGANMLMHDRDWTNAALYDIVTGLQDRGYDMVDPKLIKTKTSK